MTARALLERLAAAGLSVAAEDGKLLIRPAAKFTDALRAQVVAAKADLIKLLGATAGEPAPIEEPPFADRQARSLQQQRERRATRPRVDYYPSAEAMQVINLLRQRSAGVGASSIIDRALVAWGGSGILSVHKRPEARGCCDAAET